MNRHVERAALRARSWLMSRRWPRRTLLRWRWSLVWWLRIVVLVLVVPLVAVRWLAAQVVGFGLVLAGWSPPLTLAGLDEVAPVEFGSVSAATSSTSTPVDDGFHGVSADVAARHALMDRVEAMQRQETARELAWRQQVEAVRPMARPRRVHRSRRSFRSVVRVVLVLLAGWWLVLFVFGAVQSYRPLVNGPHGIHLPASVSAPSQP